MSWFNPDKAPSRPKMIEQTREVATAERRMMGVNRDGLLNNLVDAQDKANARIIALNEEIGRLTKELENSRISSLALSRAIDVLKNNGTYDEKDEDPDLDEELVKQLDDMVDEFNADMSGQK